GDLLLGGEMATLAVHGCSSARVLPLTLSKANSCSAGGNTVELHNRRKRIDRHLERFRPRGQPSVGRFPFCGKGVDAERQVRMGGGDAPVSLSVRGRRTNEFVAEEWDTPASELRWQGRPRTLPSHLRTLPARREGLTLRYRA